MSGPVLCGWVIGVLAAAPVAPAAGAGPQLGTTDPPRVALEARLVNNRTSPYILNFQGRKEADFVNLLREEEPERQFPPPPAVDLVLQLRNSGKEELRVWIKPDRNRQDSVIVLELQGLGAVNLVKRFTEAPLMEPGQEAKLAPGRSVRFAIVQLQSGYIVQGKPEFRRVRNYWTQPGDYTLTATYQTRVFPAPEGAADAGDGFGHVSITSPPLKVQVNRK